MDRCLPRALIFHKYLSQQQDDDIARYYIECNENLIDLTGIDLSKYGYSTKQTVRNNKIDDAL